MRLGDSSTVKPVRQVYNQWNRFTTSGISLQPVEQIYNQWNRFTTSWTSLQPDGTNIFKGGLKIAG